ncbi:DDB1- and CUL4-associated factor 17 isoform 2-T2 [Leptodactylus fuscus]|uniref:DDB1- and CUL4-associated factor 17 isoform X2 n=1 Tax=Leptodactylus fuscus TaxID=238119 RepID=UPI003F4E6218
MSTNVNLNPSEAPRRTRRNLYSWRGPVKNVCILISRRCLGSFPKAGYNNLRSNMDIVRKVMCQESTKFKRVWTKDSKSSISYVNGRIYFANYSCCYSSFIPTPQLLYEVPRYEKLQRIEDVILCECPLGEPLARASDYTSSLIAVTGHNWLLRFAADTGEPFEWIYLGAYRNFRYITWEVPQETLVVKSVQNATYADQSVIFYLAVFNVFPLSLVGVLEIDKKVFGSNVCDAMISDGLLFISHTPGLVRLYSFKNIVQECLQKEFVLGETSSWRGETGIVGRYPFGIPSNITLTERPPVLFEVPCLDNAFELGGYPWHYIITPNKKKERGTFHICSMEDHSLVKNGIRDMNCRTLTPDYLNFHTDSSERILHVGPRQIIVLKLKEIEGDALKYEVTEDFIIHAERVPEVNKSVTFTSSGRRVKKWIYEFLDDDPDEENFVIVEYEDELDMLVVVAVKQTEVDCKARIDLYCNQTGKLLKKFLLEEYWDVTYSHVVAFDRDTLIHIEEKPNRNFSCYVYKMCCGSEES